jgi:endonuclease YncB( thermonuclease family)
MIRAAILACALLAIAAGRADAHRSGCHRWHSCPSDTGSYICGDLGYSRFCLGSPETATPAPVTPAPSTPPSPSPADITGTATVIDGDTLEIRRTRVRLHGIDAPESAQWCRAKGERWRCGQRVAFALADKIGEKPIRCERRDIDRYGRTVAVCYLGNEDLNAWLVSEGLALAYRRYSLDYVDEEEAAEEAGRGMWRGEFVAPWDWRRGARLR